MAGFGGRVQRAYEGLLTFGGLTTTVLLQLAALAAFSTFGAAPSVGDDGVLAVIWQVHAAFASIGFAGLAIAFQVLGDPPLSAGSARHSVVTDMRFGQLLVSGIAASAVIGIATIWLASPGAVAVSFVLVLAPSVLIVAAAYARLGELFSSPQRIEDLTLTELKQRVRQAAAAAATQEEAARKIETHIDLERGLVSGSLPGAAGLPMRRIRNPYYGAVVTTVDTRPMVHAADYLAWEAHVASTGTGFATYDYPQRVSVRARPNKRYRPGDTLFEMHDWPGIDEATWAAISRQLFSGLHFTYDQSQDATFTFAEDMSALQDSVLAAVRDRQIARAARGYGYYHQTIHEARLSAGNTHLGLRDPRWFERQIAEIDDAAARSTDRMAFVAVSDAERMAYDAVKTEDLAWLRLALDRLQRIWSVLLTTQRTGAVHARENLLVTMQNLAEFAIPYSFSGADESDYARRQLIWTFTSIAKNAIDTGDVTTAERVLGYMGGLHDYSPKAISESRGVDVAVGQAAVLAWILLVRDKRKPPGRPISVRLDAFPRRHYPPDMLMVLRAYEAYRDEAPWRFWESEDALPFQTHVVEFENYFRQAVLLLAADRKLRLPTESAGSDDRYLLQETQSARDEVQEHWEANRHDASQLEGVAAELGHLIDQLDERRRQRIASMPLSSTHVEDFHKSIIGTVQSAPRLATFLKITPLVDPPDDHGLVGQVLRGLPKDFFVDTDVIASPSDLGHQIGAAVLRDQDLGILMVLLGDQEPTELQSDGLPECLHELAKPLRDPVVIYNGQSRVEEVLTVDFTEDGMLTLAGYAAYAMYVGDTAFLADFVLVDREGMSNFDFLPEDNELLTPLPEAQVAVGIREEGKDDQGNPTLTIEYGQTGRWFRRTPTVISIRMLAQ